MIIGFAGPMGSGKTTAAKVLEGHGWERRSFADPIRKMMDILDPIVGFDGGWNFGIVTWKMAVTAAGYTEAKQAYPEIRRILQVLGTEIGREMIDPDLWADLATRDLDRFGFRTDDSFRPVVFDDVRFDNEAEAIKLLGGSVVEITRPGYDYDTVHRSEAGVSRHLIDESVVNDADETHLRAVIESLLWDDDYKRLSEI